VHCNFLGFVQDFGVLLVFKTELGTVCSLPFDFAEGFFSNVLSNVLVEAVVAGLQKVSVSALYKVLPD